MSRVTTPPTAKPVTPTAQPAAAVTTAKIPHDRIAMRAYDKWVKRGRPQGTDMKDWMEAEAELLKEVVQNGGTATRPQR